MKILQTLKIEILYNGHLQAFGAASLVYVLLQARKIPVDFLLILATYFSFVFIFVYDRVVHVDRDNTTNRIRSQHIQTHRERMQRMILIQLIISMVIFYVRGGVATLIFMALLIVAGYLYPHFCKDLTKYIPLFKNIYVSIVYPLLVFIPFSTADRISEGIVLICVIIFCDSFLAQMILDTKDIPVDKNHGLKTFGALFGIDATVKVVAIVSVVLACIFVILGWYLHMEKYFYTIVLGSMVLKEYIVYLITQHNKSGYLISAGLLIFWLPFYGLGNII